MKIGILFYGDLYKRNRDWNRNKYDVKHKIIDCWCGHEVKTYLSVMPDTPLDLINFYNPSGWVKDNPLSGSMAGKIISGLEMLKNEDLDYVIVTRLDVIFFKKLSELNFDLSKYNLLFKELRHWDRLKVEWWEKYYTCDVMLAFPRQYIQQTIDSIWDMHLVPPTPFVHLHVLYSFIEPRIGRERIHFLSDEHMLSGNGGNKFYLLDRYNEVPGDLGPCTVEEYLRVRNEKLMSGTDFYYQGDIFS